MKEKEEKKIKANQNSYPEGIKKSPPEIKEAYRVWASAQRNFNTNKDRKFRIPDKKGKMRWIDCATLKWIVLKNIEHLDPKSEYYQEVHKRMEFFYIKRREILTLREKWDSFLKREKNPVTSSIYQNKKAELLELFGQWKTTDEILKIIHKDWGFRSSKKQLEAFKVANKERISELRENWAEGFSDFGLAKKRGRVEQLCYLYATQNEFYLKENKYPVERAKMMQGLLDSIKKEIEGDKLAIDINGNIDINVSLNINQSIHRVLSRINFSMLVVGLEAAKKHKDPYYFMNQLATSWYSRFNGIKDKPEKYSDVKYPSQIIYNWNEIEAFHKGTEDKEEQIQEAVVMTDTKEGDLKSRLLELLQKKGQ